MALSLEAGVNSTGIAQKIEFFNHVTNQFDLIQTNSATITDSTVTATVHGTTNYVNQSTGVVRAKVSYKAIAPVAFAGWQARFDRVNWIIGG